MECVGSIAFIAVLLVIFGVGVHISEHKAAKRQSQENAGMNRKIYRLLRESEAKVRWANKLAVWVEGAPPFDLEHELLGYLESRENFRSL